MVDFSKLLKKRMSTETTVLEIVAPALPLDTITATEAAIRRRDELLTIARRGTSIKDAASAERAAAILKDIAAFTRVIEETRTTVKAPILEAGKRIDATAKALVADLEAESKRIGNLVGAFKLEQERRAEEERRRAWEEQERIRKEAEERERRIREEAEAKRRALRDSRLSELAKVDCHPTHLGDMADLTDEQFAKVLADARTAKAERDRLEQQAARARSDKAKAEAERKAKEAREAEERRQREAAELAERQRQEREQREKDEAEKRRQADAAASAKAAQVSVVPKKIEGVAVGTEIKFEVTDIRALHDAHPMFVLLSPNNAAIKAALKQLAEGQSLPGVRHWREAKTVVR